MKREILFRGKRIDNGDWAEGGAVVDGDSAHIVYQINEHIKRDDYECYAVEVDSATISQFTGLIDKNGQKIFEDDVVHHGDSSKLCFVAYKESGFYCAPTSKERYVLPLEMWLSSCVVIGNVFDNPELAAKHD